MAMNSDGSYDAVDSGGFGKDYHGQDAFGERVGGTGIGGDGHEGSFDAPDIDTTELSTTDSSFEGEANEVADSMRESIRGVNETTTENSNVGSMDTSFQIGGIEEDLEKARQEKEEAAKRLESTRKAKEADAEKLEHFKAGREKLIAATEKLTKAYGSKKSTDILEGTYNHSRSAMINNLENIAKSYGIEFDRSKLENDFREVGPDALNQATKDVLDKAQAMHETWAQASADMYDLSESSYNNKAAAYDKLKSTYESSTTDKTKTSFTDKMKPSTTEAKTDKPAEAKPDTNMAKASVGESDYLTKANKDSTKELPPSGNDYRNDFGNHAADTLKGISDRITGSVTVDALGLKSIEEFARENGYDPNKLSTMKAYLSYQNKEIMKAVPGIVKEIGSYITERVKDAVDPSQLPERIRNTIARYNLATLIGAAILSIKSGAGLQASIDQALTMVDTEDQAAVSDYLEDVLSDEGTVNDLGNAFDDALAPEQNSDTAELDESIVNIGRKDNTDYDDFNAGLGSSGTTSDADVKVFISRNVKADPILRKMISKIGK